MGHVIVCGLPGVGLPIVEELTLSAQQKVDYPDLLSAERAVIVPSTLALSSVKPTRSWAMSSCALASSTLACAVCNAWLA